MRYVTWWSRIAAAGIATALAGCTLMGGIGGSSQYGCAAPPGVKCDSVSGNYYNALQQNLPSQRPKTERAPSVEGASGTSAPGGGSLGKAGLRPVAAVGAGAVSLGSDGSYAPPPLRSEARVLRMWFKPWEDADRDLYDQGYVYVQIDDGQWLVDHVDRQTRDAYAPVRPPRMASGGTSDSSSNARVARSSASKQDETGGAVGRALRALGQRGEPEPGEDDK